MVRTTQPVARPRFDAAEQRDTAVAASTDTGRHRRTGALRRGSAAVLATRHSEALIKTGALQTAIFNSPNFSSIATDEQGVIQIFNVGAERMLGYTASEVTNRITPADISDSEELIQRAHALSLELGTMITPGFQALVFKASRGIEDIYELTYIRKDGSRFPAIVSVTALRDAAEKIIGYLLIGTDNTARKEVEAVRQLLDQRLQERNVELEHASRMKSEFLATMSHELRTPLNAVIGFSEALRDGLVGPLTIPQQEYIADIFTSGQHLLSLINDILDLSKIEAGMMALELETVALSSLLSSSLTIVREKAAAHHVALELEDDHDFGLIELDIRKTKQILYNLLSNAVKFSGAHGRVVLKARRVLKGGVGTLPVPWPIHAFPLAPTSFDEFLELSVTDGGMGIAEADMLRLFQSFSQIDSGLARKFEGTGLGLAMVKRLSELHGGTVAVASAVGVGTCFAAWLPLRTTPDGAVPLGMERGRASGVGPAMPGSARMALVVEDDPMGADLVRLLLQAEGFTVLHARSAEDAVILAARQTLSLITVDIDLPGIDGWAFLLQVREIPELARVPVVIISGLAETNIAFSDGAAAVLQKPLSRTQLRVALGEAGFTPSTAQVRTVLLVDADPQSTALLSGLLPPPSYSVLVATTGEQALEMARTLPLDLMILDLMLPRDNGMDVLRRLRADPKTASLPVIVVTAKQMSSADRAAIVGDGDGGKATSIVEKARFSRATFMDEVKRALEPA